MTWYKNLKRKESKEVLNTEGGHLLNPEIITVFWSKMNSKDTN